MRQLLILALVLTLLTPFTTSAQTSNCTVSNVLFDEPFNYSGAEPFSLSIVPPAGCAKPNSDPANVSITKGGSYLCSGGTSYSDVAVRVDPSAVVFTAKCAKYPNYIESSSYRITVKFGLAETQPGYYCNRTDPVKPYCDTWTSASQGQNIPYMQCMTSCQPSRNWVDIKANPALPKYLTGQIINFLPESNILGSLTKFNWDFGDNILRDREPYREEPVVYSTPGKKTIKLSVTDPKTGETIATSTEIKVKCVPPNGGIDSHNFNSLYGSLYNNQFTKITANNYADWEADKDVSDELKVWIDDQQCQIAKGNTFDLLFRNANSAKQVVSYLSSNSSLKQAAPLTLLYTNIDLNSDLPSRTVVIKNSGLHAVIELSFTDVSDLTGNKYKLEILDPGIIPDSSGYAPIRVTTLDCRETRIHNVAAENNKILTCDDPLIKPILRNLIILNPIYSSPDFYQAYLDIIASPIKNKNTPALLRKKVLSFGNFQGIGQLSTGGVCAGWSDLSLRLAYLADFVGECASIPTAAAPTETNNLASTGLLDFLNSLFNQLLRPILVN